MAVDKKWIIVSAIVLIVLTSSLTLILKPDSFTITLNDGTIKVSYSEGNLKVYSGRYVAFEDYLNIYYFNGKGYVTMYKARGAKYSNLSYYQEGDTTFVKQDIYYSQGNLTRYFEIKEYTIKESFEWNPNDENLRVYFLWNYGELDKFAEKQVYLDKNVKGTRAVMDFNIINNWEKELNNIVRVERFQNGKLSIRTRVYEGKAQFDPEILLEKDITKVTKDDVFKELKLNDASKTEAVFSLKNPTNTIDIKKDDIKINFNEVCGKVNSYKVLINSTCEAERIKEYIYGIKEVCYTDSVIDNKTSKNITKEICNNETFVKDTFYENYTYICYDEFEKIDASDLRDIKIEADVNWDTCADGTWGYQIDWQVEVTLDDGINKKILRREN